MFGHSKTKRSSTKNETASQKHNFHRFKWAIKNAGKISYFPAFFIAKTLVIST